jgi:hypothetical protein
MRTYKGENGWWHLFFTVNPAQRHGNDLLVRHIGDLREAFRLARLITRL